MVVRVYVFAPHPSAEATMANLTRHVTAEENYTWKFCPVPLQGRQQCLGVMATGSDLDSGARTPGINPGSATWKQSGPEPMLNHTSCCHSSNSADPLFP